VAVLTVAADARRIHYRCELRRTVFASDDVVFAWAIGKAALVVIVCVSTLVYAAWAVTYQRKNAMDVGIPRDGALRRKGSVKADKVVFIANRTAEEADGILARTSAGRSTTTSATHFVRLHSAINFSERNRT